MADLWKVYGVRNRGGNQETGIGPLPTTKAYECGICNQSFGLTVYPTINDFYQGHYLNCGVPKYGYDWE